MSITIGQGCKQTNEKWVGSNHWVGWRCETTHTKVGQIGDIFIQMSGGA